MSDDEEYVTLTEALEWEKRVRAESEDALYEALVEAKTGMERWEASLQGTAAATIYEPEGQFYTHLALLDAVRLIRAHEWAANQPESYGYSGAPCCPDCEWTEPDHTPSCEVGSWVRAAERAGL